VPAPPALLDELARAHPLDRAGARLWPWSRTTAWRLVKTVMEEAAIRSLPATPKGLRHGFGVHAVMSGIPLNLIQKWLGHADIATPPSTPTSSALRNASSPPGCGEGGGGQGRALSRFVCICDMAPCRNEDICKRYCMFAQMAEAICVPLGVAAEHWQYQLDEELAKEPSRELVEQLHDPPMTFFPEEQ
jgi:hypothetical protein